MKNLLLASTAVVLLSSTTPGFAQSAGSGAWVSVEGGMSAIATGYDSYMYPVESTGYYDTQLPGTGINMSFEAGIALPNTPYSLGLGFRHSSSGSEYNYYPYYEEDAASFTTLDFEVGRDISLGGVADGRVTLGVRGALIDANNYYYGHHSSYDSSSSFVGAGPRVALEASVPVMNRVSVDLEAGVAMLFGTTSTTYDYGHHGYPSTSNESSTVTNMDFSAALSYLIGSSSKVSLGYRHESFTGLNLDGYGPGYQDTLTDQGAFLKFTTGF